MINQFTPVLKNAGAPDIDFPNRKNSQQKLFDAKQAWLDHQPLGDKDSNKAALE